MIRQRRRNVSLYVGLTAVLLFGLGPGGPTPALPQDPVRYVTTSQWLPFEFDTGEILFTGSLHLVVRAIPGNPILPPNPIRVHVNGLVPGTGGARAHFHFDTRGPFTGAFSEILVPFTVQIPGNPIKEIRSVSLFLVLNPNGTVNEATEFAND